VHHGVAHVQFAQVFDERFHIAHLLLLAAAAGGGAVLNSSVSVTKSRPCSIHAKALREACGGNAQWLVAGQEFGQRIEGGRAQAAGAQEVQQAFAAAIAFLASASYQDAVLSEWPGVARVRLQSGSSLPRSPCGF
jgi:hypothetical protein